MLYATTRDKSNIETAYKSLHLDCAADGALFVPFRMPQFSTEEILALKDQSFCQNMAQILNLFFGAGLTGWDVEFMLGKVPVKFHTITHRIFVAEGWHNSHWKLDHMVQLLSDRLCGEGHSAAPSNWAMVAVRIAVLFASYGQLMASETIAPCSVVDVAVATSDFAAPMAAWYARKMGLPVGNIVCGCNANGGVWDLLHQGEISTGGICVKTLTPDADILVPRNLERLVFETLGMEETHRYLDCCRTGSIYGVTEEAFEQLRKGLFAAVISDDRINTMIHSVYRTSNYVFSPYTALAYGSLLDYRAKTGESRGALLLSERSPICDSDQVARAMQVPLSELIKRINIS